MLNKFVMGWIGLGLLVGFSEGAFSADPVRVRLTTTAGVIDLELDATKAPITVENFVQYVKAGHYEGTVFHRVMKNFMIQGGGYDQKDLFKEKKTGKGIQNEAANGLSNTKYTVAMARTSDPNSATSQFFINTSDENARFLDKATCRDGHGYCVFGKVIAGLDVVDKIEAGRVRASATGEPSEPVEPIVIQKAEIIGPPRS